MNICIMGHRPQKLFGFFIHDIKYHYIREAIKRIVWDTQKGEEEINVYSGMALGVDQIFVEEMINARDWYRGNGIKFNIIAAVPCMNQDKLWDERQSEYYRGLLKQCDKVVYVNKGNYTPACMKEKNKFIVDNSGIVIAVWDGRPSGTGSCARYAHKEGKPIYRIYPDPNRMKIEFIPAKGCRLK